MKDTITRLTGFEYVIPTHQGRAAENVLFSHLVHNGDIVPGNSHFDTTKGHIESRKAVALDCTVDEAKDTQLEVPFKGNVDPAKLETALKQCGQIRQTCYFRFGTLRGECLFHQDPGGRVCGQDHQGDRKGDVFFG